MCPKATSNSQRRRCTLHILLPAKQPGQGSMSSHRTNNKSPVCGKFPSDPGPLAKISAFSLPRSTASKHTTSSSGSCGPECSRAASNSQRRCLCTSHAAIGTATWAGLGVKYSQDLLATNARTHVAPVCARKPPLTVSGEDAHVAHCRQHSNLSRAHCRLKSHKQQNTCLR